jgi:peptide-methionine (S)-S-oxide reductase
MIQMKYLSVLALPFVLFASFEMDAEPKPQAPMGENLRTAIFAGGCFWCMEPPYDELPGVVSTISGYAGGHQPSPTYRDVTSGRSGHLEVIEITYDPEQVSYEQLLDVFWVNVDPLDAGGQFCDRGESYSTAVFVANDDEHALVEQSIAAVEARLGQKVVTPIRQLNATGFTAAEGYHQDYYVKNPLRYKFYRTSCGRDARLKQLWGE